MFCKRTNIFSPIVVLNANNSTSTSGNSVDIDKGYEYTQNTETHIMAGASTRAGDRSQSEACGGEEEVNNTLLHAIQAASPVGTVTVATAEVEEAVAEAKEATEAVECDDSKQCSKEAEVKTAAIVIAAISSETQLTLNTISESVFTEQLLVNATGNDEMSDQQANNGENGFV